MTVHGLPDDCRERRVGRKELAAIIGVSERTITNWVREGMPSDDYGMQRRVFLPSRCLAWARARGRHRHHDDQAPGLRAA